MNSYLEPVPDGLELGTMQPWTAEKLYYLKKYLGIFTASMRVKQWRALNYIDLFSGPGKCVSADGAVYLGSPLLALTSKQPFDRYFFVDEAPLNIETLKQRCQGSPIASRIRYYTGDGNVVVDDIVEQIRSMERGCISGRWSSCLNLAFLDPFGLELEWNTVKKLATLRTDLIIHYSRQGLQRFMIQAVDDPTETIIDRFFGTHQWREIYNRNQGTQTVYGELLKFYKQRLCDLGYKDVESSGEPSRAPLMRNTRNAPLYRLVFASKGKCGEDFWNKITQRDLYGQGRLF